MSFYLVAASTIRLVGDSLFADTVRSRASEVSEMAVTIGERFSRESSDMLHQRLLRAARSLGGRLLIVDGDGKVQLDTFGERVGQRLALAEVYTVLRGEADMDYGFHLQDGNGWRQAASLLDPLTGRDVTRVWMGCFAAPLDEIDGRRGVLVLVESVQDTVDSLISMRERMLFIFGAALIAVLVMVGLISGVITKPVAELSAGIERMASGDYQHRVHVPGHSELAQLAETFNQMSEQVHNLDEARNQFVSNASHEIKTPLATIKLLVESMIYQKDMDEALRCEFLGDINKEIDRLSSVVSDLLTLVQIDTLKSRLPLRREMMVFSETVRDSVKRLLPLAKKRKLEVKLDINDSCEMFADSGKLEQVCYNIIENAIKYTPEGGKIAVRLRRDGREAVLEIADTGVGIPEEDLPHIFERFYRVDKARVRETGGTGLGLSIVQQMVRMHRGSVTVHSVPGKGTTFTVRLPLK